MTEVRNLWSGPPVRQPAARASWSGRTIGVGLLCVVALAATTTLGMEPDPVRFLLLTGLVGAVSWLLAECLGAEPADWTIEPVDQTRREHHDDRLAIDARTLQSHRGQIARSHTHARLVELAATRLEQAHGLALADPGTVALLGHEAAGVLIRAARPLTADEVRRILTRIEGL